MTQFKTFLVLFFAFISLHSNAQIAKGNYSLDGNFGLNLYAQKYSNYYQSNYATISLNPAINKFITKRWSIGFQPIMSFTSTKLYFNYFQNSETTSTATTQDLGLGINTRYYFAEIQNIHFFGKASFDFEKWKTKADSTLGLNNSQSRENYQIGIGANIFLNSEVALEPSFDYGLSNSKTEFMSGTEVQNKNSVFSFNIKMNNFVNLSFKKKEGEATQYVKKGRQIVGGEVYLSRNDYESSPQTAYLINPKFSQFVTDKLLVGGEVIAFGGFESDSYQFAFTSISGRYYFPIRKRFYIYPALKVEYYTSSDQNNNTNDNFKGYALSGIFGGSYFLSNNIALDATFLQIKKSSEKTSPLEGLFGVGNVRLLYFIR
jgi:hypothetical protein